MTEGNYLYSPEEFYDPALDQLKDLGWGYEDKEALRQKIAEDTQVYLDNGGTVTVLPPEEITHDIKFDHVWGNVIKT